MTVTEQLTALGLQLDRKSKNSMRLESIDNSLKIDGFSFLSYAEKRRYIELKLLEQRREIFDLLVCGAVGISYPLKDGKKTLSYQPTFTYSKQGERVFEDVRKMQSETNKRKIQMMKEQIGLKLKLFDSRLMIRKTRELKLI
ncbi:MAG: DUF1064 domain-containing protein [Acidobacteriota bacterium]|nr:DUF1064 domain-containing protein [Acidobacteriota bacterium]